MIYTHMNKEEIEMYLAAAETTQWLRENPQFDVRVGKGAPVPAGTAPNIAKALVMLTQHRIDVLCEDDKLIRIVEIKRNLGMSAIGQVIGYEDLLNIDAAREGKTINKPIQKVVICKEIEFDMPDVCKKHNIQIIDVGLILKLTNK